MNNIIFLLIISIVAFIINLIVIPVLISISHKKGWYDVTNDRKIHSGNIPRIGGVGIFVSFLLAVFLFVVICKFAHIKLNTISRYHYLALSAGFLIITFFPSLQQAQIVYGICGVLCCGGTSEKCVPVISTMRAL
jgi:UDP-GlcNAc:undecaprenyl-phosphate GlcNAc-1-phosphate transferase